MIERKSYLAYYDVDIDDIPPSHPVVPVGIRRCVASLSIPLISSFIL